MGEDFHVISTYSRKQALEDGTLVAVDSDIARDAGIRYPAAMTVALLSTIDPTLEEAELGQSLAGRMWDLLSVFRVTARQTEGPLLFFSILIARTNGSEELSIKAVCGPGDDAKPVITFMLPNES